MAFARTRSGDRLQIHFGSIVPKQYSASYVAAWAAGAAPGGKAQVAPLVGDLVKLDTATDDGVLQCVASDVPYGMVYSINSGNGTLSVIKFAKVVSVELEYSTAFSRGNGIQANGSPGVIAIDGVFRDQVKPAGTFGYAVALDKPRTGLVVVEFNANTQ
jgi:hypothetical protein